MKNNVSHETSLIFFEIIRKSLWLYLRRKKYADEIKCGRYS